VNWGIEDAAAALALVVGAATGVLLALHFARTRRARYTLAGGVIAAAIAIRAELAVGIF
jgi:hypothetical protein